MLRSDPALYIPAGVVLLGALVAALVYYLVGRVAKAGPGGARFVRRACLAVSVLVVPLLVLGFLAGFEVIDGGPLGTPLLIGGGLLLGVLARLLFVRITGAGPPPTGERAALAIGVAVIVLCSFWAVDAYARQKGVFDAEALARHLYRLPAVTLDTPERLHLDTFGCVKPDDPACRHPAWAGVREAPLADVAPGERFRYRYVGLRLLAQPGKRMFLIPRYWTWQDGNVLVLPVDDNIRIAFHPG
ncbi:hypothetical protein PUR71_25685 [Streptomyces sp. SP17BM10]|uniref:hypothetical protein n=1 Tax=Streptomyces sp. SP17BM10 TaxID=3002530 RepID=UPI002E76D00C|nr:hypothetical protein [Streptomyces sp. SP17BM10]MEE1786266.1 hypothetical protein [Streptomyces sp. SP17BM10]